MKEGWKEMRWERDEMGEKKIEKEREKGMGWEKKERWGAGEMKRKQIKDGARARIQRGPRTNRRRRRKLNSKHKP